MRLNRTRTRRSWPALSAPRQNSFLIAVVLGALGIVGAFVVIPVVTANAFWLVAAGFLLLVVACLTTGF